MTGRRKTLEILMRARMRTPNITSIPSEASRHASPSTTSSPGPPQSAEVGRSNPVRDANVGKDVRGLMNWCVSSSTAEPTLEEFLQNYYDLPSEGRWELLLSLARDYDVDRARVRVLMQQYLSLTPPCFGDVDDQAMTGGFGEDSAASAFYRLERNLCVALKPKYGDFVDNLNAHPGGLKLLVDMRADLLSVLKVKNMAPLRSFNSFLKEKLITWLSPATLELHHITWDDSASLLEKIVAYEAVHPIRNLLDLKRRLSPGRRCFGYLHPAIPGEPLIFIEVALLKNIAQSIEEVLWDSPPVSEKDATCALFYSVSLTQAGLSGINLGKFIIKRVIELMKREMPHVSIFATLSPIPGFMQWLRSKLHHYWKPYDSTPNGSMQEESCSTFSEDILDPEEERLLIDACPDHITGESGMDIMQKMFSSTKNQWAKNDDLLTALKPILMRLCVRYLLKEKKRGKALDVVANFHLQNGAMIERINWMADPSESGLYQSGGIMVNYVYRPNIIEENAQSYSRSGIIQASDNLRFCVEKNS